MPTENSNIDRLLKVKEVAKVTAMGVSTVYRLVQQGKFPRPVKRGRSTYWKESDIKRYIESLPTV